MKSLPVRAATAALYTLFFLLLFWPVFTALSYHALRANLRDVVPAVLIVLECLVGLITLRVSWMRSLRRKTARSFVWPLLASVLFLVFLGSLVWAFVLP